MQELTLNLFDQMADVQVKDFCATFEKRNREMSDAKDLMQKTIRDIRRRGWKTHATIWNACSYLNTVAMDVSRHVYDLAFERDDWRRRMAARHLIITAYESSQGLIQQFGGSFRRSSKLLNVPDDLMQDINKGHQLVAAFEKNNHQFLKERRVTIAAHLKPDSVELNSGIEEIDLFDLLQRGLSFGILLNDFGGQTQKVLAFISSVQPPEIVT